FCLDDGSELLFGAGTDEPATIVLGVPPGGLFSEGVTRSQIAEAQPPTGLGGLSERQSLSAHRAAEPQDSRENRSAEPQDSRDNRSAKPQAKAKVLLVILGVGVLVIVGGFFGFRYFDSRTKQIGSIAVMPFVNESGNADVEYLSDGMTEALIESLSQLPGLNVKSRSSVFRYKGKDARAQTVGTELNVQAILNGRVIQRGQDLTLYVELVDAQNENILWKQTYNKTMTNLVTLQADIARDVAEGLKVKLSGTDAQKLAKKYTADPEAYQLYLRGRYHYTKLTPPEIQIGISYLQQAIQVDPKYALAYAGLSDSYRSFAVAGDLLPSEYLPKAKAAAQKAIELDDTLPEAHTALGVAICWGDWDWRGAETEYQRAIELNPNSADAYLYYAHLLSNLGRHEEALVKVRRAREIEPLDLRISSLEALFMTQAGRNDDALERLRNVFELDPNYWLAHCFAASAYIEKGMFTEAVEEARKARMVFDGSSQPMGLEGYALAKAGRNAEAKTVLEELIKLSPERYAPYHTAIAYNGMGHTNEALDYLERAYQQRSPRMVFLKVEPKWNNLRSDPRFQNLMKKMSFPE
ncbi:MAG: tetratricopeptide repeat protein, partial [Acidobacteriota bacterium]